MNIIICLLIMFIVTYIPRAIPICFIKRKIENNFINSILFYMPYAVLASLTFPAMLYVLDNIIIASIATIISFILAILNQKMIVNIIITVVCAYLLMLII